MATCADINPALAADFAAKDTNRIQGSIGKVLVRRSPWLNILSGGNISNDSDTVRSVVQERAVSNISLAEPEFVDDTTQCGECGDSLEVGETEYSYSLQTLRGEGPLVCVKTARTAFKDSYLRAQEALEHKIVEIMNADVRATLLRRSGVKYNVNSTLGFNTNLTGDAQQIDTLFNQTEPDAPLNFDTLYRLLEFEVEEMLTDTFESSSGMIATFIGSNSILDAFRKELDVRNDLRYLTTGRYKLGEMSLTAYQWEGPYKGIAFGRDPQPLRATGFYTSGAKIGQPILVNPESSVATSKGVAARRNPSWVYAPYEIGFLVMKDSFRRLVPEKYTGEGKFKFAPQYHAGELQWWSEKVGVNKYGDFGQFLFQIQRAYQPYRPHAVIPIIYKRCPSSLGVVACASGTSGAIL